MPRSRVSTTPGPFEQGKSPRFQRHQRRSGACCGRRQAGASKAKRKVSVEWVVAPIQRIGFLGATLVGLGFSVLRPRLQRLQRRQKLQGQ
jgi:hypothetical protein